MKKNKFKPKGSSEIKLNSRVVEMRCDGCRNIFYIADQDDEIYTECQECIDKKTNSLKVGAKSEIFEIKRCEECKEDFRAKQGEEQFQTACSNCLERR